MERIGYPDLATHRLLHQRLLTRYGGDRAAVRKRAVSWTGIFYSFSRSGSSRIKVSM